MLAEIEYGKYIKGEVIDFTMMECGNCGIPFFVPTRWKKNKVKEHGSFCCPNGCNRVFVAKSDEDLLKDELEKVKAEKAARENELTNKWLDALGEKQKIEKQLKRTHKGVCPCCNRTFQNLQRHMETKHKEIINPF